MEKMLHLYIQQEEPMLVVEAVVLQMEDFQEVPVVVTAVVEIVLLIVLVMVIQILEAVVELVIHQMVKMVLVVLEL